MLRRVRFAFAVAISLCFCNGAQAQSQFDRLPPVRLPEAPFVEA